MLVARRRDRLDELAAELGPGHGVTVTVLAADLGDRAAPGTIAQRLRSAGIEVDFLVNNAGFGRPRAFCAGGSSPVELEMIDVNVHALVELTHLFLPGMLARKRGRILNVASVAGFLPGPFMATYYASKAFVLSFTEALASELRGTGVTATASCPGPTETEFGAVARNEGTKLFRARVADAASVARHAWRAMMAGRVVAVPGLINKLIVQSVRLSPRALLRSIAAGLNTARSRQPVQWARTDARLGPRERDARDEAGCHHQRTRRTQSRTGRKRFPDSGTVSLPSLCPSVSSVVHPDSNWNCASAVQQMRGSCSPLQHVDDARGADAALQRDQAGRRSR